MRMSAVLGIPHCQLANCFGQPPATSDPTLHNVTVQRIVQSIFWRIVHCTAINYVQSTRLVQRLAQVNCFGHQPHQRPVTLPCIGTVQRIVQSVSWKIVQCTAAIKYLQSTLYGELWKACTGQLFWPPASLVTSDPTLDMVCKCSERCKALCKDLCKAKFLATSLTSDPTLHKCTMHAVNVRRAKYCVKTFAKALHKPIV